MQLYRQGELTISWLKIVESLTSEIFSGNILDVHEGGKSFTGTQSKSSCFFCFEADGHFVPLRPPQNNRHFPEGREVMHGGSIPGDRVIFLYCSNFNLSLSVSKKDRVKRPDEG